MFRRNSTLKRTFKQRRILHMETLEGRRVMATGFLQGVAFHDFDMDQKLDAGETRLVNATIELWDSTGTTFVDSTTTDSKGQYLLDDIVPGNYLLKQLPVSGYVAAGTQTDKSRINPAVEDAPDTIAVTVRDPARVYVNYAGFDPALYQTVNITFSAGPTFTASGSAGVMRVTLGSTPGATNISTQFTTFCVNLLEPVPFSGPITFTGTPSSTGLGAKSGEIGYLYNHFAQTVSSPAEAAGLQFAIWELIYDGASPNLTSGNLIFNGPGPFHTPADFTAAIGFANSFLAQAAGQSEPVTMLDGSGTTGQFQSMLATGSLNFANITPDEVGSGQTATIGYWQNKNGQALLKSLNVTELNPSPKQLGNWMAATFPNLFSSLANKTNSEVADIYRSTFKQKGQKLEAQVMAVAFAVYVTDYDLAGNAATTFGFEVTAYGLGRSTFSIGTSGSAFDVANGTQLRVIDILLKANEENLWIGNQTYRNMANEVFTGINEQGDIL